VYAELLERVAMEQERYGAVPQHPATEAELTRLRLRASEELGVGLPDEYEEFLKRVNGLDWNGVLFFATQPIPVAGPGGGSIAGVVEMNLAFRDDPHFADLLALGSDGLDVYTYRSATGTYEIYDEVPHNLVASGLSFEDLMTRALTRCLQG